jgi:hypothetical protein
MTDRSPQPARVPVLTQVIDLDEVDEGAARPMPGEALAPMVEQAPLPWHATPVARDEAVVARVMEDLHRHIDAIIERRVQAALEPIWRRLTEDLSAEVRTALALSLKETLRQAVGDEMQRMKSEQPDHRVDRSDDALDSAATADAQRRLAGG